MSPLSRDQLVSQKAGPLLGTVAIPGDKSISHRSLILGSLAIGTTKIRGLLEGADVMSTKDALIALGVTITRNKNSVWQVIGIGLNGMVSPTTVLNLGNSGTGVRLLMGVVAGQAITATFCGDESLSGRPMARITNPLVEMGAKITSRDGGLLPVTISGVSNAIALDYHSKVASAQVKSAILLAGLNARGATNINEPQASRDHSESMLRHFGASVEQNVNADLSHHIQLSEGAILRAADITVPSDPSSAAFAVVAALITPGSDINLVGIGTNPSRAGLIRTLIEMGGKIDKRNERIEGGELVADLRVRYSQLHGIVVPADRAASMIDEYPILSVAAATAIGTTEMLGIAELRVKETDRIKAMADGLIKCGVNVSYDDSSMCVANSKIIGGPILSAQNDHRIAMSFLSLGLIAETPITVTGCNTIETSFPGFASRMNQLGASISDGNAQ
ncbi:3-phosphoshikimate 1-carboxyvinyltransferase [Candidatus Puniceispirillum sp.]|nr:3-phosphoshikimate 1-carboxyvinyltransferase [Candidatus Puniceispirillum sp.]